MSTLPTEGSKVSRSVELKLPVEAGGRPVSGGGGGESAHRRSASRVGSVRITVPLLHRQSPRASSSADSVSTSACAARRSLFRECIGVTSGRAGLEAR
eukprot:scaffold33318_cov35-Tisochrysis_lutea.AAC.2